MASSEIHLFKKFAIAAGRPNNYYLNPSENLWKIPSKWSVVEHKDVIDLKIHMRRLGEPVAVTVKEKFININLGKDGYKMPAGYADKNGMNNFTVELNPNFLNLGIKVENCEDWAFSRMYISKLNAEEINKRMHVPKPEAEGNKEFYISSFNIMS